MTQDLSFAAEVFHQRRKLLATTYADTLFVIPAGRQTMRSHSVAYPFQVAGDFRYLTGLSRCEGAVLIIAGAETTLLQPPRSSEHRLWDGDWLEETESLSVFTLAGLDELESILRDLSTRFARLAFPFGRLELLDDLALTLGGFQRSSQGRRPLSLLDSSLLVGRLRLVKDENEINCLREAGRRSSLVHRQMMARRFAGASERDLANSLEADLLLQGLTRPAYLTIVGGGERATILHARATNRPVKNGELVLVDAAGEWQGYCADITRVVPVGQRFSAEQRQVYEVVLAAQKAAIHAVQPLVTLKDIHEVAQEELHIGLCRLGMTETEARAGLALLQPHGTSHWLGLDVHDPSPFSEESGEPLRLQAGMCFTIEPGLYFREPGSKFSGIGVRIEDDILVTPSGHEVLTSAPKEVEEIEELRARSSL